MHSETHHHPGDGATKGNTVTKAIRRQRWAAPAAVVLATALLVSGCSTWFPPDGNAPTGSAGQSTPTGEDVAADLKPFYTQVIDWTDCGDGMQCGTATAPLDWSTPAAGSIELAVVKHPATGGPRLGSLLVNPGGPGGSGYDFVKDSIDFAVKEPLQKQYDVVGFDPRGVGRSSAVSCLDDKQMDAYLYDIVPGVRGSDEWLAAVTAASKDFGAKCAENTGDLLKFVDTVSAARDLDLLRAVLGDSALNYLGYSYGTFLGSTYADLYPTKVGRVVLDGALDPTSSSIDVSIGQAVGFEHSIRAYLTDCLGTSNCPFTGTVDDAMASVGKLLAQVDASPLRGTDGRQVGSSTLLTAIIYPLYDATAWSYLSDMFRSVMSGDADYALQFADGYNSRDAKGVYSNNSTEAFTAINCLDYPSNSDPAVTAADNAALVAAAPTIGPYWTYGDIGCANWPYQSTRTPHAVTADGTPTILVVGTTGDPATPYKWAQALAGQLSKGQLITYNGEGHTAYGSSTCVSDIVNTFLLTGDAPSADPQCTN